MATATEGEVDTSEIDLLDDPYMHALCRIKYPPEEQPHDPYVGICGTKATMLGSMNKKKCPRCVEIAEKVNRENLPCPACGKTPKEH